MSHFICLSDVVINSSEIRKIHYQKDIDIIGAFAAGLNIPVPLFEASKAYYSAALSQGFAKEDTGAVCAVLERMAGNPRAKPRAKRKNK